MIRLPGCYSLLYAAGNREITRRSPQAGDYTREMVSRSTGRLGRVASRPERIALIVFFFVVLIGPAVVVVRIDVAAAGTTAATLLVVVIVVDRRDRLRRMRTERQNRHRPGNRNRLKQDRYLVGRERAHGDSVHPSRRTR